MKIMFLVNEYNNIKWGYGRFVFNVIDKMKKSDNECTIFIIPTTKKNHNPFNFISQILKIRQHLKKHDLIHVFDGSPLGILGYLANIGLGKKIFISAIGTYSIYPLRRGMKAFLLKKAYRRAQKIFCISNFVKNKILYYLPDLKNLVTIFMGISTRIHQECLREKPKTDPVIISVGAMKMRKGQHLAILALKRIKETFPRVTLRIIGGQKEEEYYQYLRTLTRENGLEENIIFFEAISDEELKKEYKSADLFLMPSLSLDKDIVEGFGLVYLEAAAFGLPCVGSKDTGAEDAILDGQNGYLIKQGDERVLAEKVIEILSNTAIYRRFSEKSLWWAGQFSWEKTVNEYIKFYKK